MNENTIAKTIVDCCFRIHTELGPGLLESVYEIVLAHEIVNHGLQVERQKIVPLIWEEHMFQEAFRADLVVERKVIIELKSVERIAPVHGKQLLTYLRLMDLRLGLLVNFGDALIKHGIKRVVNGLPEG